MNKHLKYLRYVLIHKWYVFLECYRLGIPWRGLLHDLSKFRPSEWFPYVEFFYGLGSAERREANRYSKQPCDNAAFDLAWLSHQKRNPHHWQWWILPEDAGGQKVLPMPDKYRREMLADWVGAGRALGNPGVTWWYTQNKSKMCLHSATRDWIEEQLWLK